MSKLLGMGGDDSAMKAAQQQLDMQRQESEKMKLQAEQERRDMAEQLSAKQASRRTGGSRLLLSEARLNPETGVDETLGAA